MITADTITSTEADAKPAVQTLMLRELCAVLTPLGIARVTIVYDGYGDEGQIEGINLEDLAGEARDIPECECKSWVVPFRGDPAEETTTLANALDSFGYEMLTLYHDGWENGEGAFGECTIEVTPRTAELNHSTRFTETNCSVHTLKG